MTEPPTAPPDRGTVLGLPAWEEHEPSSAVLARVAWNGPVLDPDQLTAAEFLAALP